MPSCCAGLVAPATSGSVVLFCSECGSRWAPSFVPGQGWRGYRREDRDLPESPSRPANG